MRLDPPGLGHMQRMARKTIASSEKGEQAAIRVLVSPWPGSKDSNKTLLHRGRAASWSNHVPIHALFFIHDIGRHGFPSKPNKVGGSTVCRQLVNFSPSRKISVSVLRILSHPDPNIDFPGVCPGPAPLPPDLTSIPPSHSTLKSSRVLAAPGSFFIPSQPQFLPDTLVTARIFSQFAGRLQVSNPRHHPTPSTSSPFNLFHFNLFSTQNKSRLFSAIFSTFQRSTSPSLQDAWSRPGPPRR